MLLHYSVVGRCVAAAISYLYTFSHLWFGRSYVYLLIGKVWYVMILAVKKNHVHLAEWWKKGRESGVKSCASFFPQDLSKHGWLKYHTIFMVSIFSWRVKSQSETFRTRSWRMHFFRTVCWFISKKSENSCKWRLVHKTHHWCIQVTLLWEKIWRIWHFCLPEKGRRLGTANHPQMPSYSLHQQNVP